MPAFTNRFGFVADRLIGKAAGEYVSRLRIRTPSVTQPVQNLSGGNQQKAVVAKWLVRDCDILIFDEPTRGIDVGAKDEIYALLDELAAEGKAIIMISSELPEILRMSHRIAVMCEGRITAILDNADATQEKIMHYATQLQRRRNGDDVTSTMNPTPAPIPVAPLRGPAPPRIACGPASAARCSSCSPSSA